MIWIGRYLVIAGVLSPRLAACRWAGLQLADMPDQLSPGGPGAVADLLGQDRGQPGHFAERYAGKVASLAGEADQTVPLGRPSVPPALLLALRRVPG
jgi:hypothetical protein